VTFYQGTGSASKYLGVQPGVIYPLLTDRSRGFVYIARKTDSQKAAKLEKLDLPGLGFYPEELRTYPQDRVAAQVLGYAGTDNHGLEGLEKSLDPVLAGRPGSETIVKDPLGGEPSAGVCRSRRGSAVMESVTVQLPLRCAASESRPVR
jgi:hypothetical protein